MRSNDNTSGTPIKEFEFRNVRILSRKEISDARRNRWFILYTAIFALLALALSWLGLSGLGSYGLAGFGRTTASLINLVMLIVPLMGITMGAMSLSGERERGTLLYLFTQPLSKLEILTGKYFGLSLSILASLMFGFGISGVVIGLNTDVFSAQNYIVFLGLTYLLALISIGIGMLISSALRKADMALGIAIFVWLAVVFVGDLGLIGTIANFKLNIGLILFLTMINPLQAFKMLSILILRDNLEIFGPAGNYAMHVFGGAFAYILIAILIFWIVVPFVISWLILKYKGIA